MMGLFRKRSTSSVASTKLKRPMRSGTLPPEPSIPPAPIQNVPPPQSSFTGPTRFPQDELQHVSASPNTNGFPQNGTMATVANEDGFSTLVSQISGLTHPSDAAAARSTAPSSVDAMSAISSFKRNGPPVLPPVMPLADGPQVHLNGQRISTSTMPDDGFYLPNDSRSRRLSGGASVIGSEFDSRPSSMTATGMPAGNRKPPPPPLRDNPSTSTLPQEWTDRDPSINTRFTHSPTPSESASMQSSMVYPQQPQPERRYHTSQGPPHPQNKFRPPHPYNPASPSPAHLQNPNGSRFHRPPISGYQYRPNSASQRVPPRFLPPPTTPRGSYRGTPNMLPSLPENRRAQSVPPNGSPRRPNIPPTPGPKSLALTFTSNHIECNNRHQTLLPMKNYHHPVPCLTCRRVPLEGMQYCTFCALRICKECALRLKKEWGGDITKGWGGVTPAVQEFSNSVGPDAKMVAGWGDRSPPIPAKNAVEQLTWPSRSNTERVCAILGVPYRPKTAPSLNGAIPKTPDLIEHPQFNFDSNLDLESGPSTLSPPSPVTPPAFGGSSSTHRLPLTLPNEHRLPLALTNGKQPFEAPGYGYSSSPEILSDSNPELVQPRPYHPVDAANILNVEPRGRSHTFNYVAGMPHPPPPPIPPSSAHGGPGSLYRTDTATSATTVGKNSTARPVTGSTIAAKSVYDTSKSINEKKRKGFMGLFKK